MAENPSLIQQSLETIVSDTPEICIALRAMIGSKAQVESDGSARPPADSKPPLNLTAMEAADAEFASLAFWADIHYNIQPAGRTYRRNGMVCGLVDGHEHVAQQLASDVLARFAGSFVRPADMFDDLWRVRRRTFGMFPRVKQAYLFDRVDDRLVGEFVSQVQEEAVLFDVG